MLRGEFAQPDLATASSRARLFEASNARSPGCRRESQVGGTADSTWSEVRGRRRH
jgi:hypothetical protein